eukprot:GHVR01024362.1.p1 GENE.GHVR01024362.1~~GHVR01024362.1.p1  ORF type:complete len:133 (+),score=3.46 GHVR01024362.1:447-845(+)
MTQFCSILIKIKYLSYRCASTNVPFFSFIQKKKESSRQFVYKYIAMSDESTPNYLLPGEVLTPTGDSPDRKLKPPSAFFSLVATLVGGGLIPIGYCFALSGLLVGAIVLVSAAVMNILSVDLIVACSRRTGC